MGVFSVENAMPTEAEQRTRPRGSWLPEGTAGNTGIAVLIVALFLLTGLASSGIWDPHELRRAELARRIAIHLFGASELAVDHGLDVMPTLSDLGAGELPFTSMALGLAAFGLVDWAGRLPLALWGAAGALVVFAFLARYVRPRAGVYAVVVLVTMPLYFMQARTMLGDVVTMAAFAMAFFGGLGMLLESRSVPVGAGWTLLSALGLVAGYGCRGALLGVAAPALSVGASWWVVRSGAGERPADGGRGAILATGLVAIGAGASAWGLAALHATGWSSELVPRVLGFAIRPFPPVSSTFDLTLRDLGHGLFPWSAVLPVAFARLWWMPPRGQRRDGARQEERLLRVTLVVGVAMAFVVHAGVAPQAGSLPFVATTLLAAVLGLVVSDFERGAPPSALAGFVTIVVGLVLVADLRRMPSKLLTVFHVPPGSAPSTLDLAVGGRLMAASLAFLLVCWLTFRDPPTLLSVPEGASEDTAGAALRAWLRRRIGEYEHAAGRMAALSGGNVAFALLVVEAGLVGLGIMLVVGRQLGWQSVTTMWRPLARIALNAWWAVPLGLLALMLAVDLARALFAFVLAWTRLPRASAIAVAALVCGGVICFGDYVAIAQRMSPKGAFTEYAARRGRGDPLALLGVNETSGRYYAGGAAVLSLSGPREAVRWLEAGRRLDPPERRWLVLDADRLAPINALFRQSAGMNLPVLGDDSGETLLASSELGGAVNDNPLEPFVLQAPPTSIQHRVDASLGGRVHALGWELRDERGDLARAAIPGRRYELTVYYRVVARLRHDYQAFLHVDGEGRRHNADHEPVGGRYPSRLWRAGDVIADVHELVLEPNFTPGHYVVYFGLFIGKKRLEVRHGPHRDDRVVGGTLVIL